MRQFARYPYRLAVFSAAFLSDFIMKIVFGQLPTTLKAAPVRALTEIPELKTALFNYIRLRSVILCPIISFVILTGIV